MMVLSQFQPFAIVAVVVAGVGVAAGPSQAAIVDLDPFSEAGVTLNVSGSTAGSELPAASVLGGKRVVSVFSSASSTLTIDPTNQSLTLGPGSAVTQIGYGFVLGQGNVLLGTLQTALNADLSGFTGMRFNILQNPPVAIFGPPQTRLELQVSFQTNSKGTSRTNFVGSNLFPESGMVDIPFSDFIVSSGTGADLRDVDHITVIVRNGLNGNTISIGPIQLIPEPTTAAMLLAASGGLLLRRRGGGTTPR